MPDRRPRPPPRIGLFHELVLDPAGPGRRHRSRRRRAPRRRARRRGRRCRPPPAGRPPTTPPGSRASAARGIEAPGSEAATGGKAEARAARRAEGRGRCRRRLHAPDRRGAGLSPDRARNSGTGGCGAQAGVTGDGPRNPVGQRRGRDLRRPQAPRRRQRRRISAGVPWAGAPSRSDGGQEDGRLLVAGAAGSATGYSPELA